MYYAVVKGHKTGVYNSWDDCQEQVIGYSQNQYERFATKSEAEDYVQNSRGNRNTVPSHPQSFQLATSPASSHIPSCEQESSRKRFRIECYHETNDYKRTRSIATSKTSNVCSR